MSTPTSIADVDLRPVPGKAYFSIDREWREEFIYFLMIDRFQDDTARPVRSGASCSAGVATPNTFYGGTIMGITQNLDYIVGLGCTAHLAVSSVREQRRCLPRLRHQQLPADRSPFRHQAGPHFVDAAHNHAQNGEPHPIRIILDVVINYSGDNWFFQGGFRYFYFNDQILPFGDFRRGDRPVPIELRNQDWYPRRGEMRDYDHPPENQHGDISTLKDYANEDDAIGSAVINALITAHCYWIREADVDGFRVDAVKHMGELACSRFCSNSASTRTKRGFFLFGEVATPSDDIYNRYIGQNTSTQDGNNTDFFGLDSLLDFRLAQGIDGDDNNAALRDVLKGSKGPQSLFNRLEAQRRAP